MTGGLRKATLTVILAFALLIWPESPLLAQNAVEPQTAPPSAVETDIPTSLDYAAWQATAERTEAVIADRAVASGDLEEARAQLVDWRHAFSVAQSGNSTRIASLRTQIAALGDPPPEGTPEAEEIASRRTELSDQLVRLQAPGIAADEAYRRADGLIREIDSLLRERQADELLRLMPAPINPANWPPTVRALSSIVVAVWSETAGQWQKPETRKALGDQLPLILLILVVALTLLWRGRVWIDALIRRLRARAPLGRIWVLVASLGQVVVAVIGVLALTTGLILTGMFGPVGISIIGSLPAIGFSIFAANWLGAQAFPVVPGPAPTLNLSDGNRSRGRFATTLFGLLLGVEALRRSVLGAISADDAAASVLAFPILLLGGLLLLRIGNILRRHKVAAPDDGDVPVFRNRVLGLLAQAAVVVGFLGPLLAAIGYIAAGAALIFPAALSLALVAVLFIVQQLIDDVFAYWLRGQDAGRAALLPVLISFVLSLATVPLFALIWGARFEDLTELWTRFREGFQLGTTRVSPTDFLFFAIIFGLGYMVTRLFQGALKSTILPKTNLDQGGQNAITAGVGYTGIFLAGLVAIRSTGIDLSGLAIIAGALSLGIGFGLQNIVSNFVSGIILLIERPVSEGDWIEVGTVQGIVKSISVRSTRIQTFDRSDVIVPNADFVTGRVTNWTRFNLTGRLTVPVGVVFDSDTRAVERILREIAEAQPLAILNPPPVIAFMGFGADAMNFEIRVILRDINFNIDVRSEINHQIVQRFAEAGIGLAHASREVTHKFAAERAAALAAATIDDQGRGGKSAEHKPTEVSSE